MEPLDQIYGFPLTSDLNSSSPFLSYLRLFNVSSNLSTQSVPFQGSSTVMTALISLTVFLVGLTGNTLAIYVVLRYAKMKTVTNSYILNLAVADELYIIGLPLITTQNVLSYWPFGSFLCRVVMTADSMNQFTSIFCLTVMSIDRYLAVVHPIRSTKWRHPRVAKVVSAAVWALSFVVVLPVVIFSDVQETKNRAKRRVNPILLFYIIVIIFASRWPETQFSSLNMVNLVVIIPESSATAGVYFFAVILSYANSCANPVLYGFLSDNFRQSFRKVLCVRSVRCKANGVDDGDPSAPRTEKTTRPPQSLLILRTCLSPTQQQTCTAPPLHANLPPILRWPPQQPPLC
ncbi:somatostatin-like receptor F_48D10.1 [Pseudoliparis swirei]|uniref:somatostatin-like receptor F_48D10.1 n=1 Tax=Pseudoliparis swirei TaxID=2059687 RepID=UPI0024BEAB1E|nr:somatostatin-like receptor F_48D10.1 [Pseudoliparis swirei]